MGGRNRRSGAGQRSGDSAREASRNAIAAKQRAAEARAAESDSAESVSAGDSAQTNRRSERTHGHNLDSAHENGPDGPVSRGDLKVVDEGNVVDEDTFAGSWQLVEAEADLLRDARIAKAAASRLSLKDATAELGRMSERSRSRVARGVGRNAALAPAALANAVRTHLARETEDGTALILHDALHAAVLKAAATQDLDVDEMVALLSGDTDNLAFLASHELRLSFVRGEDDFGVSPMARAAAWSAMATRNHKGAIAPLAWLVADPPDYWTEKQRAAVSAAWELVRTRVPALPEHPLALAALCEVVVESERAGVFEVPALPQEGFPAPAAEEDTTVTFRGEPATEALTEPAAPSAPDAGTDSAAADDADGAAVALTTLSERAQEVLLQFESMQTAALPLLIDDIKARRLPDTGALTALEDLHAHVLELYEVAETVGISTARTSHETVPALIQAVADRLDELAANGVIYRVRRLTGMEGPLYVASEIEEISTLAAAASLDTDPDELAALDALVRLIEIGNRDPERSSTLLRAVAAQGAAMSMVAMSAQTGALSLPATAIPAAAAPPTRDLDTASHRAPEPGEASGTGPAESPKAADETADETDHDGIGSVDDDSAEAVHAEGDTAGTGQGASDARDTPDKPAALESDNNSAVDVATDADSGEGSEKESSEGSGEPETESSMDDMLSSLGLAADDLDDLDGTGGPEERHEELGAAAGNASAQHGAGSTTAEASPPATDVTNHPGLARSVDEQGSEHDSDLLHAQLLQNREYALAGWLAHAVHQPRHTVLVRQLAAHADALRAPSGTNAAAFKDVTAELMDTEADAGTGELRDASADQLLLYAAAVRAGLLSPTAGAADALRDLCPNVVRSGAAVETMTNALLSYVYSGAYLTSHGSSAATEVAAMESSFVGLVDEAKQLLDSASSRTIRYAAATELYKDWMEPDGGYLGRHLAIVASGSRRADDLRSVREGVTELRSRSSLSTALDNDARKIHGKRSRRIEARARENLFERAGYVAAVLESWVETAEALTQASNSGWMANQFTDLRAAITDVKDDALTQLEAMTARFDAVEAATAAAGLDDLRNVLALITGDASLDDTPELDADCVVNGPLALAADLPLRAAPTIAPKQPPTVADLADAAAALAGEHGGWNGAFDRRTQRGDHVGTGVLVELARVSQPDLARRLIALRDRDIEAATASIDAEVAEVAGRLDSDRRFGRLDTDTWTELSIKVRSLEPVPRGKRHDFDVMRSELARAVEDRDKAVAKTVADKWQELSTWQENGLLDDSQAARISECLADEDITTADEYFESVRDRKALPEPKDRGRGDHLRRFFPAFPTAFNTTSHGDMLTRLMNTLEKGERIADRPLNEMLEQAGLDLSQVRRPAQASSRIEQWLALSKANSLDTRPAQVRSVMEQIGFTFDKATTPPKRTMRNSGLKSSWVYLSGVRQVEGKALIPAFGSRMSPAGNTLRVLGVWGSPTPGRIVEKLRDEQAPEHAVVVLYFGTLSPAQRLELADAMRSGSRVPAVIVVDDAVFGYLCAQPTPRRDTTMAVCLPFANYAPFTPDVAGLVPLEMFYGRTTERDLVLDRVGPCIVFGGRQLGKSALLRAAARDFNTGENRAAIYQSIYQVGQGAIPSGKVWATIWPRLAEKGIVPPEMPAAADVMSATRKHIVDWITADPSRQILMLLDESDFFLDDDAKDGQFTNVNEFRELMEQTDRAVKVVFAGLHQTARFERLSNHPLAHFGKPICVGPLSPQHAYNLLVEPLRALGYRFENDNIAARVLALANNQPSLVQLFGARLLTHVNSKPRRTLPVTVTGDDIELVWSDAELREEFRRRFDWTLGLDHRYKVIAYTVAYNSYSEGVGEGMSATELRSQCEQWWPQGFAPEDVRTGEFRALLDECVSLGVLSYAASTSAYRLRTPNVLALLGTRDEVLGVLDNAENEELPHMFDGAMLRPLFMSGPTAGPLTATQIAELLEARNQVVLIAGSEALTVGRVARALHNENEAARISERRIPIREATAATLEKTCASATQNATGHTIVLVDLQAATPEAARAAWAQARGISASHASTSLGIVLVSGPQQAPLWQQAQEQSDASATVMSLYRFNDIGLRLWLNDTELHFQDAAARDDLLRVSGGWPWLLNRIVNAEKPEPGGRPDVAKAAAALLGDPGPAQKFVRAAGLESDHTLRQAWMFLRANLGEEVGDEDTLRDLLELAGAEDEYPALSPRQLKASGYGKPEAVLGALRLLGLLPVTESGDLRLEPITAAAAEVAWQ